jgi:hypothetical protein
MSHVGSSNTPGSTTFATPAPSHISLRPCATWRHSRRWSWHALPRSKPPPSLTSSGRPWRRRPSGGLRLVTGLVCLLRGGFADETAPFGLKEGQITVLSEAPAAGGRPPTRAIVSGASSNHFDSLVSFLENLLKFNPMEIPVFLYDIGLTAKEATWLREQYPWAELRRFKFDAHPAYFDINIAMGEYAWKPVIIKEMLDTVANKVLWLDSGDRLTRPSDLQHTFDRIEQSGFVTTQTSGTTQKWVHPGMHAYLHSESMVQRTMCNGAIIGFDRTHSDIYTSVVVPWASCALQRDCIAPQGSSRQNHRQDQAALTVILYQSGHAGPGDMCSLTKTESNIQTHQEGAAPRVVVVTEHPRTLEASEAFNIRGEQGDYNRVMEVPPSDRVAELERVRSEVMMGTAAMAPRQS